jgi:hypothetical protein
VEQQQHRFFTAAPISEIVAVDGDVLDGELLRRLHRPIMAELLFTGQGQMPHPRGTRMVKTRKEEEAL